MDVQHEVEDDVVDGWKLEPAGTPVAGVSIWITTSSKGLRSDFRKVKVLHTMHDSRGKDIWSLCKAGLAFRRLFVGRMYSASHDRFRMQLASYGGIYMPLLIDRYRRNSHALIHY